METFQGSIGSDYMSYGAAYFPWLNTSVLGDRNLTGNMFIWKDDVYALIDKFTDLALVKIVKAFCSKSDELEIKNDESVIRYGHTFKFKEVGVGNIYADADTQKKNIIGKVESVVVVKDDNGGSYSRNGKNSMGTVFQSYRRQASFSSGIE